MTDHVVAAGAPSSERGGGRLRFVDLLRADTATFYRALNDRGGEAGPAAAVLRRVSRWVERHGRHLTKLHYCPPLRLVWSRRPAPGGPADIVQRCYVRAVWGERRWPARLPLLAALAIAWPAVNLAVILWATGLNGARIRARTGKGVMRQFAEQWALAIGHSILPPYYYVFDLHDPAKRRQAHLYLQRFETKGGLFRLFKRRLGTRSPLHDKVAFARQCARHGVPTAPVILEMERGKPAGGGRPRLPPIDLFAKPAQGRGGEGAERWDRDGEGWLRQGRRLDEAGLLRHLAARSAGGRYLLQPRLVNHRAVRDLSNGALSTVRLLTCMDERGGFEATNAVFRMAVDGNSLVDNFHAGGIAAAVDMATGALGPATDLGMRAERGWCERHPNSGAMIRGRRLPHWPETLDLVARAHAAFPDRIAIGWDVAVLDEGPQIIEANGSPDLDIHQRCEGRPLGDARAGALLAYHARRLLEERPEGGRPAGAETPRGR